MGAYTCINVLTANIGVIGIHLDALAIYIYIYVCVYIFMYIYIYMGGAFYSFKIVSI